MQDAGKSQQSTKPEVRKLTEMVEEIRKYKLNKDRALKKKLEKTKITSP